MRVLFLFFSLFFLEELVLRVLHVLPSKPSNPKPSKIVKPKLFWKYPFWKNMKKSEIKPINPLNGSTHPPPPINPSTTTKFRSTHQTHLSINPSTTTKFPNQETKTLFLYKTKLHGRKREEAPPHAYRKEREREREMSTRNGVK